jgi:hypothetical protein
MHGKPFDLGWKRNVIVAIKLLCCLCNVVANIILLAVLKDPADYELLVAPIGIAGWLSLLVTNAITLRYFQYAGQWIPKLLNIWVFVCTSIRWPSQRALGNIAGQEYYFQLFLAMWVPQAVSVILTYFEFPVTKEKFFTREEQMDLQPSGSVHQQNSTMAFRAPSPSSAGLQAAQPLAGSDDDRAGAMRSVPWTTEIDPEGRANFVSRLFYMWMSPLFKYAHKHTLEDADVWDLRAELR